MGEGQGVEEGEPKSRMFADLPPRVKLLIYLTFPSTVGFGYYFVVMSAYLPEIGLSSSYVGLIFFAFSISMIVVSIPLGLSADRHGRKRIIQWALLGIPLIFATYGLTTNVWIILATSLATGVIEAAFLTSWNALIADMTTVSQRNAAFSLSFVVNNAASGVGFAVPVAFPAIEHATGWSSRSVHGGGFLVLAALAVISYLLVVRLLRDYKESFAGERTPFIKGEGMRTILKFSAINALIGLGAGFIIPLVPTLLWLEFKVPDTYSGPLLASSSILMALSAVASAKMAKRYGEVTTIVLTQGTSTVFMFALAFSPNATVLASLYLVRTALMNMASPVSDSYLMGIISEKERGVASAINGIVWRVPNSVSTLIGGVLLAQRMYTMPFFLAAGFYAVSITLFYSVFRNIRPHH